MEENREATEMRRRAQRLRQIGAREIDISDDLVELAAVIERQAKAVEQPIIAGKLKVD